MTKSKTPVSRLTPAEERVIRTAVHLQAAWEKVDHTRGLDEKSRVASIDYVLDAEGAPNAK